MSQREIERAYAKVENCRANGIRPETGFESMGYGDVRDFASSPNVGSLAASNARLELAWRGQR